MAGGTCGTCTKLILTVIGDTEMPEMWTASIPNDVVAENTELATILDTVDGREFSGVENAQQDLFDALKRLLEMVTPWSDNGKEFGCDESTDDDTTEDTDIEVTEVIRKIPCPIPITRIVVVTAG